MSKDVSRSRWTLDEDNFIMHSLLRDKDLSIKMGRSIKAIRTRKYRLSCHQDDYVNKGIKRGQYNRDYIIEHFNTKSMKDIANDLDLSYSTILSYSSRLRKKGVPIRKTSTHEQVLEYCEYVKQHYMEMTIMEMANVLGLTYSTVDNYAKRLRHSGELPYKINVGRKIK